MLISWGTHFSKSLAAGGDQQWIISCTGLKDNFRHKKRPILVSEVVFFLIRVNLSSITVITALRITPSTTSFFASNKAQSRQCIYTNGESRERQDEKEVYQGCSFVKCWIRAQAVPHGQETETQSWRPRSHIHLALLLPKTPPDHPERLSKVVHSEGYLSATAGG